MSRPAEKNPYQNYHKEVYQFPITQICGAANYNGTNYVGGSYRDSHGC